jgi:hypothetical protein
MTARWLPAPLLDAAPHHGPAPADAVVRQSEVGPVAWQVLRHEGVLEPLTDDVAVRRGTLVRPAHRAAALAHRQTGARETGARAVCGAAAVWVHTGGEPPVRVETCLPTVGTCSPGGVVVLGGVRVLDPVGTAVELLCRLPADQALPWVDRLRADAGLDLQMAWRALGAWTRRRGVRQATTVLRRLLAAEPDDAQCRTGVSPALAPVIRYTSNTPSTLRTADSTEARCEGSAISNTNRDIATRSREVDTDADRMLT